MELPDLKELKALIQLCRSSGVAEVSVGELKLTFLPPAYQPPLRKRGRKAAVETSTPSPMDPATRVSDDWDSLSDEAKMFFSSHDSNVPQEPGPGAIN